MFNPQDFFKHHKKIRCYCEECAPKITEKIASKFLDSMERVVDDQELYELVANLIEVSKIVGINEKLYDTIDNNLFLIKTLDNEVEGYEEGWDSLLIQLDV